jgi:hypothetical protein
MRQIARIFITVLAAAVLCLATACASGIGVSDFHIPPFWVWGRVVAADLNGDGRQDVAVVATYINESSHTDGVQVFLRNAAGGFDAPVFYPVGSSPWGLCVGDLDGDGRLDLIAISPSADPPQLNTPGDSGGLSILRQDPANPGHFLPFRWVNTGGVADTAAVVDVTGDDRVDVVVGDGVTVNSRILVLAQSAAQAGDLLPPSPLPVGTGHSFQDLVVADINGDGRPDLVFAAFDGVVILCQKAGGGFAAPILVPAGSRVVGVGVADLDGDGRLDVVALNGGYAATDGSGGSSVTVLLQTPSGSFASASIPVAGGAGGLAIADLNGDGLPDIAVISSNTPSKLSVLLQSSSHLGSFSVAGVYNGPDLANFLALADVNGDGRLDVILNEGPSVMYQTATPGTFAAPVPLR